MFISCRVLFCFLVVSLTSEGRHILFLSTVNSTPEIVSVSFSGEKGDQITLGSFGYGCQSYYEGFGPRRIKKNLQLELKSMSYDDATKKLLIQTTTRDENRFTLLLGDPCKSRVEGERCQALNEGRGSLWEVFDDSSGAYERTLKTLYREAKNPDSSRVGPFAIFGGRIFFVLQRLQTSDFKTKTNVVQIRELVSSCFDANLEFPVFATDSVFDLLECSLLVSEVVHETFSHFHRFRPLDVLLLTSTRHGVDFFLQVMEIYADPPNSFSSEDVRTIVHLYRASNYTNSFEILHSIPLSFNYVKYFLLQLGGMSHKNDFLCWAPLDRIVCGLWTGSKMSRMRTHLQPTEARHVCTASPNNPGLSNIISGLALSSASIGGEIVLHFGCVAQVPGMGGFGFLRAPEGGGPPLQLTQINVKDAPVFAGSLVRIEGCTESSVSMATSDYVSTFLLSVASFVCVQ